LAVQGTETSQRRGALGRRAALAAAAPALLACAAGARAYDSLPTIDSDFAAAEKARKERADKAAKDGKEVNAILKPLESASNEQEFIDAADKMALWVIGRGQGAIPEGVPGGVKGVVKRIQIAFDDLPKRRYACEPTRTNGGVCYSPGKGAELAYEALIKQLRKYTIIQLGDYRRVEFNSF